MPVMTPIVVDTEKTATLPSLMTKLRDERVVYVGETHTAYGDHLLQLDVLKAMAGQPGELAIGVEWIQARFQDAVDRFLSGETDEPQFLRDIEYYDRWRFDYRLYRPLIQFARDKGIPIIALNASQEATSEISRVGINALPEALRQELPADYDFSDKDYESALREMFQMHQSENAVFERFLEAQLTWDETMAHNVAEYLNGGAERRILVLAGKGHIAGRGGIPNRVTRRTGVVGKSIGTFNPAARLFNSADFLVLANERSLPASGIMRVLLDERDGGVFVKDFTPGSPAEAAGVRKGDLITAINEIPIQSYLDIKLAMLDQRPGDEIALEVGRDAFFGGTRTDSYRFALVAASARH